jgi:hypothetical protein
MTIRATTLYWIHDERRHFPVRFVKDEPRFVAQAADDVLWDTVLLDKQMHRGLRGIKYRFKHCPQFRCCTAYRPFSDLFEMRTLGSRVGLKVIRGLKVREGADKLLGCFGYTQSTMAFALLVYPLNRGVGGFASRVRRSSRQHCRESLLPCVLNDLGSAARSEFQPAVVLGWKAHSMLAGGSPASLGERYVH